MLKTIRQVCELTGVTRRTLQEYDRIGLIGPTCRTSSGYWMYDDETIAKISIIRTLFSNGYSRKDIKSLMHSSTFNLEAALNHVVNEADRKIEETRQRKLYLEVLAMTAEIFGYRVLDFPSALQCCEPFIMSEEQLSSELRNANEYYDLPFPEAECEPPDAIKLYAIRLSTAVMYMAFQNGIQINDVLYNIREKFIQDHELPLLDSFRPGCSEFVCEFLKESSKSLNNSGNEFTEGS